jgi:hypothetical protein
MILRPIGRADEDVVIAWLARKENYQWLDFGNGSQCVSPVLLKVMLRKESNRCRVFTSGSTEVPIGLVALSNVSNDCRSGYAVVRSRGKAFLGSSLYEPRGL